MARLVKVLMAGIRTGDVPVASGLVYAYDPGTTTPGTYLYTDNGLTTPAANPATLDSDGRLEVYCSDTANFRIRVRNAADTTTIIDIDPAESNNAALTSAITVDTTNDDALTAGAGALLSTWMGFIWGTLNGSSAAATAKDLKYLHTGTGAVGRTLRAHLSDYFNVMDFGAAGTGSSDDAAALQAAIDAASAAGGGCVYVPCNIYRCDSTLTIGNDTGVSIIGDGPGSIIRQNFTNAALITISGTSSAVEIAHIQLQGGGSTITTTALGISVASGIPASMAVPVNIHDVVFSGSADGTGFNVGVEALGTAGSVVNCHFQRLYGANSRAVRLNTGSGWRIIGNRILGVDGAGTRCVTGIGASSTGGGDRTQIIGNYVDGTSGAGIWLLGTDGTVVGSNYLYLCQGAGVRVTSSLWSAITGNTIDGCQDGVLVDEDGATTGVAPSGWTISGNSIAAPTRNGVRVINATDSASYTPRVGVISGNNIRTATQSAIALLGADNVNVNGNMLAFCSTDATYPAIDVQTSLPVATHRGGNYNVITGNTITDTTGATWTYGVRIMRSGGGGADNVYTTWVHGNRFGLTSGYEYTYGLTTSSPLAFNNHLTDVRGNTMPYMDVTGSATVDATYSGGIITNSGAAGAVTMTLPNLTGVQSESGQNFTFIRIAAQNFIIAAGAGDTIVRSNVATGSITLTATTDQVLKVYARGTSWYALITDVT